MVVVEGRNLGSGGEAPGEIFNIIPPDGLFNTDNVALAIDGNYSFLITTR